MNFTITVGIPGSGKSTWCEANKGHRTVVINPDTIRKTLTGDASDMSRDRKVWEIVEDAVRFFLQEGKKDIILDATNLLPGYRRDYLEHAQEFGAECRAVRFEIDYELCLERNNARTRVVPEDVMIRMRDRFRNHASKKDLLLEGWTVCDPDMSNIKEETP